MTNMDPFVVPNSSLLVGCTTGLPFLYQKTFGMGQPDTAQMILTFLPPEVFRLLPTATLVGIRSLPILTSLPVDKIFGCDDSEIVENGMRLETRIVPCNQLQVSCGSNLLIRNNFENKRC